MALMAGIVRSRTTASKRKFAEAAEALDDGLKVQKATQIAADQQTRNKKLKKHGLQKENPFDKKYLEVKTLGKGGFGEVLLGQSTIGGKEVAIKRMNRAGAGLSTDLGVFESFEKELNIIEFMKKLEEADKLYVMDYLDASFDDKYYYVVLEYIDGKDLQQLFVVSDEGSRDHIPLYLAMSLVALEGIHSKGLIHRDIKPENIMVRRKDNIVKLVDLGIATEQKDDLKEDIGTVGYKAPEINGVNVYTKKVDYYSLGVTFLEIGLGRKLDTKKSIASEFDELKDMSLKSVLDKLLKTKPEDRSEMKDLQNEKYFVNYVKKVYPKPEVGGDVMSDDELLSAFWKDVASGSLKI